MYSKKNHTSFYLVEELKEKLQRDIVRKISIGRDQRKTLKGLLIVRWVVPISGKDQRKTNEGYGEMNLTICSEMNLTNY